MGEETTDAKVEESQASSTSSVDNKEQDSEDQASNVEQGGENQNVSEDAKTQESGGKTDAEKYQEALIALRKEREKRQSLQQQIQQPVEPAPQQEEYKEDNGHEISQEALAKAAANSEIALKVSTDPSFRDRLPEVQAEIEANPKLTINQADQLVKAKLLDQIMKNAQPNEVKQQPPKQLNPTADIPSNNNYSVDDIVKGKTNAPPELAEAMRKYGEDKEYGRV